MGIALDITGVEPTSNDFSPLAEGWYDLQIVDCQKKTSQSNNEYLNVEFEVINNAQSAGRKVWDIYSIWHEKAEAQKVSKERLADVAYAAGIKSLNDADQLHGAQLSALLGIEKSNNPEYGDKNRIKQVRAIQSPSAAPAAAAAPASAGASVWAQ